MIDGSPSARVQPRIRLTLLVAAALPSLGCASSTGLPSRAPDGAFTTDATAYVARRSDALAPAQFGFDIISRFENRGATTLYLGRCFPESPQPMFGVEIVEPAGAQSGYGYFWACVGHDNQFAVRPGDVRTDTLHVTGPNMFDGVTRQPIGILEGTFHLRFVVRLGPGDGGKSAPADADVSNTFVVKRSE